MYLSKSSDCETLCVVSSADAADDAKQRSKTEAIFLNAGIAQATFRVNIRILKDFNKPAKALSVQYFLKLSTEHPNATQQSPRVIRVLFMSPVSLHLPQSEADLGQCPQNDRYHNGIEATVYKLA
ncbi:hypothetical protein [Agrobacterium pusense]|uniref:hypothetical protein n=1 Tax=Agrobacterium pusense TaxID=648995 RepID=UPI00345E5CC8